MAVRRAPAAHRNRMDVVADALTAAMNATCVGATGQVVLVAAFSLLK